MERHPIAQRFRGFLPVVVDVEAGGFNSRTDALLEICAIIIESDAEGTLHAGEECWHHVAPFEGANIEAAALEFTGIDPHHPFRLAVSEHQALAETFRMVRGAVRASGCQRAVLVGHNATFDHSFVFAAAERCGLKRNPFHPFSCLDTVSLAALAYGQTVLRRACDAAGIEFDEAEAHSARYDARKTAELFCTIVNRYRDLGGWPLESPGRDDRNHD